MLKHVHGEYFTGKQIEQIALLFVRIKYREITEERAFEDFWTLVGRTPPYDFVSAVKHWLTKDRGVDVEKFNAE
jgi:hypothetical protein